MADFRALILQRHRHLKWKAFDWLEAALMVLCGVCIFMFTLTVFLDVVTRTLGAPWLWLQQVTTAFFAWGVFIGMAAATRRNDHFYLTEITKRMTGAPRTANVIASGTDSASSPAQASTDAAFDAVVAGGFGLPWRAGLGRWWRAGPVGGSRSSDPASRLRPCPPPPARAGRAGSAAPC